MVEVDVIENLKPGHRTKVTLLTFEHVTQQVLTIFALVCEGLQNVKGSGLDFGNLSLLKNILTQINS